MYVITVSLLLLIHRVIYNVKNVHPNVILASIMPGLVLYVTPPKTRLQVMTALGA